ncbi:hypothetical protein BD560DRAFT_6931 [Blakeslea trispora]|nr:hypothetical protein BD560DRAFT_6931 [Blakeslea trispora]
MFLPQDRVSEFAELSPPQLLERTQTAAGRSDLHDLQKRLIDMRNKEKLLIKNHESDLDELKTLNNRNEQLERDVTRMQSKKKIEDEIKLLEAQIPLVRYTESKRKSDQYREQYQAEREKVKKAKEEDAPAKRLCDETEREKINSNRIRNETEKVFKEALTNAKKTMAVIEKTREDIALNRKQIITLKNKLPEREKKVAETVRKIEAFEKELENPPSADVSEFEEGIRQINNEASNIHLQSSEIQQQVREKQSIKHELQQELDNKQRDKQQLDDVTRQRLNKLKRDYPDTVTAFEWLRNNKQRFSGRIYEPLILYLNLKDDKYADLVENALGGPRSSVYRVFICEKQEDYRLFTDYAVDKMKWKVGIVWPDTIPDQVVKTPISTADLRAKFKMEYFVSDLIQCPDLIFRFLCSETKINLIPVALQSTRELDIVNSNIFQKFAIGQTAYNVKTSLYGKKSKQTVTNSIRRAYILGNSVDVEAKTRLTEQMRTIQGNMQQIDVEVKELHNDHDRIKQQLEELKHKKEDLQSRKRDVQTRVQKYEKIKYRLQSARAELDELKKKPEEDKAKMEELESSIEELLEKEAAALDSYEQIVEKCIETYEERNITQAQYSYFDAKHSAVRNYYREHSAALEAAEHNMQVAKQNAMAAESETKRAMEECKTAGRELPGELDGAFRDILRKWKEESGLSITIEELESKIEEEKGKAEGIRYANPYAMKHYEERKQKIADLGAKIEQNRRKLENYHSQIESLKNQWAPPIHDLVNKINVKFKAAFERINCLGEIRVHESDDYDKWGIDIFVRFRNTEKLQQLTGQRQSGGERSVTTILYLMSLQDLAKSPFRVVDEINQGMDPRNERMIHSQIVKGACRPGTSQYFLITPKLLPDLEYNERVRVLCIYNSDWIPEKIKPLSVYLKHARQTGKSRA